MLIIYIIICLLCLLIHFYILVYTYKRLTNGFLCNKKAIKGIVFAKKDILCILFISITPVLNIAAILVAFKEKNDYTKSVFDIMKNKGEIGEKQK